MDRSTGMRLLAAIESLGPGFNAIDALLHEISDADERKAFRLKIADALHVVSYELVMFIVRQHPDLDPDGDRFRRKP